VKNVNVTADVFTVQSNHFRKIHGGAFILPWVCQYYLLNTFVKKNPEEKSLLNLNKKTPLDMACVSLANRYATQSSRPIPKTTDSLDARSDWLVYQNWCCQDPETLELHCADDDPTSEGKKGNKFCKSYKVTENLTRIDAKTGETVYNEQSFNNVWGCVTGDFPASTLSVGAIIG
jgi:hypothetical protein